MEYLSLYAQAGVANAAAAATAAAVAEAAAVAGVSFVMRELAWALFPVGQRPSQV